MPPNLLVIHLSPCSRDALREVQRSTTQLIREVEELETKLDSRLVELRHDLARLDVGYDSLQTAVRGVSDGQRQIPALSRQVGEWCRLNMGREKVAGAGLVLGSR